MVARKIISLADFRRDSQVALVADNGRNARIIPFPIDANRGHALDATPSLQPDILQIRKNIADGAYKIDSQELAGLLINALKIC